MRKKLLCTILAVFLLLSALPEARAADTDTSVSLSAWIQKSTYREYVEMMVDYHLRTNESVRNALSGGFTAVFLFDGCSDNLSNPILSDLSYYRVSAVCIALKLNADGAVELTYFNDNCSTIPDRPLAYGAWSFEDVGQVGPATVCDGTYQLYSVRHKGRYEALHVRSQYTDATLEAVYLTPVGGFVSKRANEINIHTRTGNHILENAMWSAGCPLVGGGKSWEFWKLMESTYYQVYDKFEVDNYIGSLVIDRMMLRSELYTLYGNPDAVDMFLANSRKNQPETYLRKCQVVSTLENAQRMKTNRTAQLMSLPCGNAMDARSRVLAQLEEGQRFVPLEIVENPQGQQWLKVQYQGQTGYLYRAYTEEPGFVDNLLEKLFG